ncbi:hypothetical protein ACFVH0_06200 [Streptomyces sp. NPDC127117]|uniref:hypothetical protein n=1 Tax=Streptomyces sp. NPDC127117 TaxID=3345368 RepID=UPI0036352835
MRVKYSALGAATALASAIAMGVVAVPAEADTPAKSIAAVSPSISPAAPYKHYPDGTPSNCAYENLCLSVWDYTKNQWKVYSLKTCNKYALSNFEGDGFFDNNQTKGTVATFYGGSGNVLRKSTAREQSSIGWSPVWSVRNC